MDDKYIDKYYNIDKTANPLFIEPKGYVFVGYSRLRMNLSNMPSHDSIRNFSSKLADKLGYEIIMEKKDSRVTLLSTIENSKKRIINQ